MPKLTEFTFPSSNKQNDIRVRMIEPDGPAHAIVQIAHGVAEHSERYDAFMRYLAEHGFITAANDHLGHGKSVRDESELGYFDERDGWARVVDDMHTLHEKLCAEHPGLPYFLFGHSMGSFLTRTYLIRYPDELSGAVICGTGQQSSLLVGSGRLLARLICAFKGPKHKSTFLGNLAFGSYNKDFAPIRTKNDWLSRNEASVDAYEADPLCGFVSSAGLYRDMMGGIAFIGKQSNIGRMRKDLPVFFIAGDMDPVGEKGKGVRRAYERFLRAGMTDVAIKLYPDCRHELLNELNRDEVMSDVLNWLSEKEKKA
ncbi:MAG: lysophospholipase [Eubacteriales bacterium]|nr:lysophospholipase [Eubacteriales bacterium]